MKTDEPKSNKPPYLSCTTLTNFLKGLDEGVIPSQIDKSLMPGFSGATQSSVLAALTFFGLTDDKGKPTPLLAQLLKAKVVGEDAKPIWNQLFDASYGPVVGDLDLTTATPTQLLEKFKVYEYGGDTLRKCHVFFIAMSELAGVPLAKHLKVVGRVTAVKKGPKKDRGMNGMDNGADANVDDSDNDEMPELEGHRIAQLPLNSSGERLIRMQAPTTVTTAELKRIQAWLSFQLIVEDAAE